MDIIHAEMKATVVKSVGGALVAGGSYAVADATFTMEEAQAYAALTATICTALYFIGQFAYTMWKWRSEYKKRKHK